MRWLWEHGRDGDGWFGGLIDQAAAARALLVTPEEKDGS